MSLPKAEDLRIVEIGRKTYLGTVESGEKDIIVTGVEMSHSTVGQDQVVSYIKTVNLDEQIVATHKKGNYTEHPLTNDEQMTYVQLVQVFERVVSKALKILENDLFTQALQK